MATPTPGPATLPVPAVQQTLVLLRHITYPLTSSLRPLCITLAAFWLLYRAYLVLHTPLSDLATLLGFDIPSTPVLDLAGVKADGCIIHWTLPSQDGERKVLKGTKYKYEILLNGSVVDAVSVSESAVRIEGLVPGGYYVVRVALVYETEFGSRSEAIRFRTKPASSGDFFSPRPEVEGAGEHHDGEPVGGAQTAESMPLVRPYRGLKDIAFTPSLEAPSMAREGSNACLGPKKSIVGQRRPSPAALGLENVGSHVQDTEPSEGAQTIQDLTTKLDMLRRETEEAERLAREEEEEESKLKDELIAERDALRADVLEKEKASRNLKREVTILERQNTAAQNERSKAERILAGKKAEREKVQTDMQRWESEAGVMQAEIENIRLEKTSYLQRIEMEKEALRAKLAEENAAVKGLEDEIKETNANIKKIERSMRGSHSPSASASTPATATGETNSDSEPASLVQELQADAEAERQWQAERATLAHSYTMAFNKLESAKRFHAEQLRYLESIRAQRRRDEEAREREVREQHHHHHHHQQQHIFGSPGGIAMQRHESQRSNRRGQSGSLGGLGQPAQEGSPSIMGAFPHSVSGPGGFPSTTSPSTAQPGSTAGGIFGPPPPAFLNLQNGMTLHTGSGGQMSDEDREKLTGGAPMSPGAGAELLPADLFSGDDNPDRGSNGAAPMPLLPGLGSLPGLAGLPPPTGNPTGGFGTATTAGADRDPGPASPASAPGSRSPSVFASPQASMQNLHLHSPDPPGAFNPAPVSAGLDADRRSIRSTRSGRAATGGASGAGSRFSSMFGIKPKPPKPSASGGEDGGGLALAQSQSLPRQEGMGVVLGSRVGAGDEDALGRKRTSSISGSVLSAGNGPSPFGEGSAGPSSVVPAGGAASRRRAFMGSIFSRDKDTTSNAGSSTTTSTFGGGWPSTFTSFGQRRPGSPRPGSTHSNELPRPSVDSSRWGVDTWPSQSGEAGARSSPLSFANNPGSAGWPSGPRTFGSRHPSRRPSVQYASSGMPEDIVEDEDADSDALFASPSAPSRGLAPIGTRPPGPATGSGSGSAEAMPESAQSTPQPAQAVPKLNPAAKDFKSFFGIKSKDKDKGRAGSPAGGPSAGTPTSSGAALRDLDGHDESPPDSRKSRSDARSMTTTESSLAESFNNDLSFSNDLARTPSYSNTSDLAPAPSPLIGSATSKESFMQKLSRKSSSGKFGLPTFGKREKSRLLVDGGNGSGSTMEVGEEAEDLSASLGSLPPSKEGGKAAGVRSWSSVLKRGKGVGGGSKGKEVVKSGGGETPSLSEASVGAGTEDGDDIAEGTEGEGDR